MSESATAAPAPRNRVVWLQGMACGAVLMMATPSALLAMILLLPSLAAAIADPAPGRPSTRAVILFGLAAASPAFAALWRGGHDVARALSLATEVTVLARCWSVQAAAWLLTQILPLLFRLALEANASRQTAQLERLRQAHEAEWQ